MNFLDVNILKQGSEETEAIFLNKIFDTDLL